MPTRVIIIHKETLDMGSRISDIIRELKNRKLSTTGGKRDMLKRLGLKGSKKKVIIKKKQINIIKRNDKRINIKIEKRNSVSTIIKAKINTKDKKTIYKFMIRSYYLILAKYKHNSNSQIKNAIDFCTATPIDLIPFCYRYYVYEENRSYLFDIRSLYKLIISDTPKKNPYSRKAFTIKDLKGIHKKILFIMKMGFHALHSHKSLTNEEKINEYIVSTFHKLYQMDFYVHSEMFTSLDFNLLKKLYYEIYDIWNYRLGLSFSDKRKIITNGIVFAEWQSVSNMQPNQIDILRIKILRGVNRLISEGSDSESRKMGANYFMLGLVQVSEAASLAMPTLFDSVSQEPF